MPFTSHGHEVESGPLMECPQLVARCGGPGLCGVCATEVAPYLKLDEGDSPRPTPKRFRIVSHDVLGRRARIYYGDEQLFNVARATFYIGADSYNRAVLELVDVDIEATTDEYLTNQKVALPSSGNVRLTLTNEEAKAVLRARGLDVA